MKPKNNKKFLTIACLLVVWNITQADILTDGTVGDIYYLFGDNMIIPESYGTRVGDNLFHSFSMFNIYSGEAVTFTGSNTLQNVIARVTGGDVSLINGILSSNIGKANFYFINPAGVTFGKNAVVDVPAAFHVSTANQINFADGSIYSATNPAASTLTIAKPESFGFLGQTGDIVLDGAQIVAKENQTIDLVANNITLKNEADLYAPAGEVRLVAAKGSQNVSLVRDENGYLPLPSQIPNIENAGNIIMDNSIVDATGNGAGRAGLWGGNILFQDSVLSVDNSGDLDAGTGKGIDIVAHDMTFDGNAMRTYAYGRGKAGNIHINAAGGNVNVIKGFITSTAFADGNAGDIQIKADNIVVDGQQTGLTMISNNAYGTTGYGNAGKITLQSNHLVVSNAGSISSLVTGNSQEKNNSIDITAANIELKNGGLITSAAYNSSLAHASPINITTDKLSLSNGSLIAISTTSQGSNINIKASDILIDGYDKASSIVNNCAGSGSCNTGDIFIEGNNLIINNGGISNITSSNGNGGDININVKNVTVGNNGSIFDAAFSNEGTNSSAGNITLKADNLAVFNNGQISSVSFTDKNAGNIAVNANNLSISAGGHISIESIGSGKFGNLNVNADNLVIDKQGSSELTGIYSVAITQGTQIDAGNINVNVKNQLALLNGGAITSSSFSNLGNAGNINIHAGNIFIDGLGGGTDHLLIYNEEGKPVNTLLPRPILAGISSDNFSSSGHAGNIDVTANTINMINDGAISTETLNANNGGNGGNITVNAKNYLYLENSRITTTTFGAISNGGNINITSPVLVMNSGLIKANAEGGRGGNINLNIQALIPSYNSLIIGGEQIPWQPYIPGFNVIQAASATGVSGTINISSPQFDISGSISGLKTNRLTTPDVNHDPCQNVAASSLKRGGKGGLPVNETKTGFIPAVAELPNSFDTQVSESPKTPHPQINHSCKPATI